MRMWAGKEDDGPVPANVTAVPFQDYTSKLWYVRLYQGTEQACRLQWPDGCLARFLRCETALAHCRSLRLPAGLTPPGQSEGDDAR